MKANSWRIVGLVLVWLSACAAPSSQSTDKAAATDLSRRDSLSIEQLVARGDSAYRHWLPLIKGDWVAQDYVEELLRTKSAYKAARYCAGATTLVIDTMKLMPDTVNARSYVYAHTGWNNHEGYSLLLDLANSNSKSITLYHAYLEKEKYGELFLNIFKGDTSLRVVAVEDGIKGERFYRRLKRASNNYDLGLSHVPAQLLFSGQYKLIQPANPNTIVMLMPNGGVNGFLNYDYYDIRTDFVGPFYSDEVGFSPGGSFVWQFSGDTLKLYDFIEYRGGEETNQGPLRYQLLRLDR